MFPKRGAIALVTTALALILLISFKTPEDVTPRSNGSTTGGSTTANANTRPAAGSSPSPSGNGGANASSGSGAPAGGSAGATPTTPTPAPVAGGSSKTVTGSLVSTRFGSVQVQITVASGKLTDVQATRLPSGGRSGQISNYVEPILSNEALQAQSATIDVISGATYTSEAYARSLQSALDKAGIVSTEVAA